MITNVKEPALCLLNIKSLEIEVIDPNQLDQLNSCFIAQPCVYWMMNQLCLWESKLVPEASGLTYIYCRPKSIYILNNN